MLKKGIEYFGQVGTLESGDLPQLEMMIPDTMEFDTLADKGHTEFPIPKGAKVYGKFTYKNWEGDVDQEDNTISGFITTTSGTLLDSCSIDLMYVGPMVYSSSVKILILMEGYAPYEKSISIQKTYYPYGRLSLYCYSSSGGTLKGGMSISQFRATSDEGKEVVDIYINSDDYTDEAVLLLEEGSWNVEVLDLDGNVVWSNSYWITNNSFNNDFIYLSFPGFHLECPLRINSNGMEDALFGVDVKITIRNEDGEVTDTVDLTNVSNVLVYTYLKSYSQYQVEIFQNHQKLSTLISSESFCGNYISYFVPNSEIYRVFQLEDREKGEILTQSEIRELDIHLTNQEGDELEYLIIPGKDVVPALLIIWVPTGDYTLTIGSAEYETSQFYFSDTLLGRISVALYPKSPKLEIYMPFCDIFGNQLTMEDVGQMEDFVTYNMWTITTLPDSTDNKAYAHLTTNARQWSNLGSSIVMINYRYNNLRQDVRYVIPDPTIYQEDTTIIAEDKLCFPISENHLIIRPTLFYYGTRYNPAVALSDTVSHKGEILPVSVVYSFDDDFLVIPKPETDNTYQIDFPAKDLELGQTLYMTDFSIWISQPQSKKYHLDEIQITGHLPNSYEPGDVMILRSKEEPYDENLNGEYQVTFLLNGEIIIKESQSHYVPIVNSMFLDDVYEIQVRKNLGTLEDPIWSEEYYRFEHTIVDEDIYSPYPVYLYMDKVREFFDGPTSTEDV